VTTSHPSPRKAAYKPALKPKAGVNFETARFAISVAELEQVNSANLLMLPEIAFVGRSNAGKSSVINALTNQRQLAYASKTPGRTQLLNFFTLGGRNEAGALEPFAYLVDLPGYGFARVDDATRQRWDQLVGRYLQTRRKLACVVLVVDARRGLVQQDEELLAWILGREQPQALHLHVLLNKSDQLNTVESRAALAAAEGRAEELPMPVSVQLISAVKRSGIDELRDAIAFALKQARV
jgi:GTP-binding protein